MRPAMILASAAAVLMACTKDAGAPTTPEPLPSNVASPAPDEPAPAPEPPPDPSRPASVTDAHIAIADKLVAVMTELGADLTAAGTDCKQAAAAIRRGAPKLKALEADSAGIADITKTDEAAKQWFMANYVPKLMAPMAPMAQLAQACKDDPDFTDALRNGSMPGRKKTPATSP